MPEQATWNGTTHWIQCYCGHHWQYPCNGPTPLTCNCEHPKTCPRCGNTPWEAQEELRDAYRERARAPSEDKP